MAYDRESQAGTVMVAFIVGAIAGAAVALLWAPATGAETRRKLGDAVEKGVERGKDAIEKGKGAFDQARGAKEKA
jgi:gas vesicle protein